MLALQPGLTGAAWQALAASLPKPKSILCISAHWQSAYLQVTGAQTPDILYDFGGFPPALYTLDYPVKGAPELAEHLITVLQQAGYMAKAHPSRGLDHGAWMPLRCWYPQADIPVLQLSLLNRGGPSAHYALGRALQALQDEDILIFASGAVTHNLQDYFEQASNPAAAHPAQFAYVGRFADWLATKIAVHDIESLLNYRTDCPDAIRAQPSEEHLLPLFVALGAGRGEARRIQPEICEGILAMDAYVWC